MLSATARMRALADLFGAGPYAFGLGHRIDGDGLVEVNDPAYARQAVTFGAPQMQDGIVAVTNSGDLVFEPWAEDAPDAVRYWFVADEGEILAFDALVPLPDGSDFKPYAGWTLRFPVGEVSIGLKAGEDAGG